MEKIRCSECECMMVGYRGVGESRTCWCLHPSAGAVVSDGRAMRYIAHTHTDGRTIRLKTCPKWCPKKQGIEAPQPMIGSEPYRPSEEESKFLKN